jgi:DNA repair protein RecN (Recombination protein N)
VEGTFRIDEYDLNEFFISNELDYETVTTLRREINTAGKSRAFINDTPVSLNLIRDISNRLIDIHSQHENLFLSNEVYQLEVVDTIAQNASVLLTYKKLFQQWRNLQLELKQLQNTAEKQAADADYLQFQYQQLTDANLVANEQEDLELEQDTLSHAEEIKTELLKCNQLIQDEQASLSMLKDTIASISKIKQYIPDGEAWFERLQSAYIDLKDLAIEMNSYDERLEFNAERLQWVEGRLSELFTLQKKYKLQTVNELILLRNGLAEQLLRIDSFDDEISKLKSQISEVYMQLEAEAQQLSTTRRYASMPIENYLVEQLTKLGMPNIQFKVNISAQTEFTETGCDSVEFLFSANKNRPVQPVAHIASGGEVSRLMLSIKSLVAHKADLPTIIFDEIDTGVSGDIAHRMAEIMQTLSADMQVITITHLPQIAAKGVQHFRVYKDDSGVQTQTHIKLLQHEERIQELAQMVSGKNITEAAILNARELLAKNE